MSKSSILDQVVAWVHSDGAGAGAHREEFWSRAKDAIAGDVFGVDSTVVDWDLTHSVSRCGSTRVSTRRTSGRATMRGPAGRRRAIATRSRGWARARYCVVRADSWRDPMALEDLTGTDKFISNLNSSWPVDDDWVDEGDNHIRGVKNVLKNTFPDTNGAVHWSASWARFPDGTVAAPGMSWLNDPDSGWSRESGGSAAYSLNGTVKLMFLIGGGVLVNTQLVTQQSPAWNGDLANWASAPIRIDASVAGIGLIDHGLAGGGGWAIKAASGWFQIGGSNAAGPTSLGGWAFAINNNGAIYGRSFTQSTFAATDVLPMTGALSDVLKLRGVRCLNTETNLPDIRLEVDGIELAFPELVSESVAGKSVNYMGLAAPLVEAIRELTNRVKALEARVAHT
jgi:hypothetical protein